MNSLRVVLMRNNDTPRYGRFESSIGGRISAKHSEIRKRISS
jgi:hypothetical protein